MVTARRVGRGGGRGDGEGIVVENEANLREAVWEILEWSGYEPPEAGDGSEGFAKAESVRPDVILLDVWMLGRIPITCVGT